MVPRLVAHPVTEVRKLTTFLIVDFHEILKPSQLAVIKMRLPKSTLRLVDTYRLRRTR